MILEIIKFIFYSGLIVLISKYILVKLLRNIAESLQLSSKVVGDIAGFATSIPELLTVILAAISGLISTSMYNIISSNVINFIQYYASIKFSNHEKIIKKTNSLKIDLILVAVTIFIPIYVIVFQIEYTINLVLSFFLLFLICYITSYKNHQTEENRRNFVSEERKQSEVNILDTIKYFLYLIIIGGVLYFVGNRLSTSLENLALFFHIPEFILGIVLGFITSLPELITFFESQKYYSKGDYEELGVIEATNNLLSSNMFNIFIIQNLGIIIYTILYH